MSARFLSLVTGVLIGTWATVIVLRYGASRLPWCDLEYSDSSGSYRFKAIRVGDSSSATQQLHEELRRWTGFTRRPVQPSVDPGPIGTELDWKEAHRGR